MAKNEATLQLERDIYNATKKQGVFGCYEVTIGWYGSERVDYITYDTKGIWRCYEIKSSLSDFRSKAKLSFHGHYNYFVLTDELYEKVKDEIPSHIGIYVGNRLKKRPKKQELGVDEEILKSSLIRSLSREADKLIRSNKPTVVQHLERQYNRADRERIKWRNEYNDLRNKLFMKYGRDWEDKLL